MTDALDPKELRRFKERAQKQLAPGNEWALLDFREYLFSHADAILALAEGHAAARDAALEEAAALCDRKGMYNAYQCADFIRALKSGAKPI